jgi:hypothetical protein
MTLKQILQDFNLQQDTDKDTTHCYIEQFYESAFEPYRSKKISILEIGKLRAMEIYFPLLKKSGIYIVEDIQQQLYPNCYDEFLKVIPDEFKSNHKWLDLRSYKNRPDDTLLIINK